VLFLTTFDQDFEPLVELKEALMEKLETPLPLKDLKRFDREVFFQAVNSKEDVSLNLLLQANITLHFKWV